MKKITITISDMALKELRTTMSIRGMTCESYGLVDAFMVKMIKAIENGKSEIDIRMKEEKDNDILQGDIPDSP